MKKGANKETTSSISKILVENLDEKNHVSLGGQHLFFDKDFYAEKFADLFNLPEEGRTKFYEAFRIVTQGQGDELLKVNSVISSSLLSLLVFYPLFENEDKTIFIKIDGVKYTKCFFEVKNKVITLPSCVDVVLVSENEEQLLFLESKFTEYAESCVSSATYGKSYLPLYKEIVGKVLSPLSIGERKDKLVLKTGCSTKSYIDGIKQSISHLIGLVRGPENREQGYYPQGYFNAYNEAYHKATKLIYGTLLYNPRGLGVNAVQYEAYIKLYEEIIGKYGAIIVEAIKRWDSQTRNQDKNKQIEILDGAKSYQTIFQEEENRKILQGKVAMFYHL